MGQVVGGHPYRDDIPRQHTDVILLQSPGEAGSDATTFSGHAVLSTPKGFLDHTFDLDQIFFRQLLLPFQCGVDPRHQTHPILAGGEIWDLHRMLGPGNNITVPVRDLLATYISQGKGCSAHMAILQDGQVRPFL